MTVEHLLKKLAPLIPEQVAQWRHALDLADHELRELLEKQIVAAAHQQLGDLTNRLLLSLPPKNPARGAIDLGTVLYEAPKWPAGISHAELMQNLAIFGRSGAGKTNLAFHLLEQLLSQRIPFLFLDWKRTARHLLPHLKPGVRLYTAGRTLSPFPFNPFMPPPGVEPAVYANHVVDVMGDAYTLGDAARSVLHKAITTTYQAGTYNPSVTEILERVHTVPNTERVRGWKASAIRALETMESLALAGDTRTQHDAVGSILRQSAIIELDALAAANKAFLLPLLCFWVYAMKLPERHREKLGLVIFVEEAHHLLYRREAHRESLMEMLLRQCREIGIGIIVIDQHPHLMSSAALGNTYTSICLNLKDPRDLAKAAALSLMDEKEKGHLSMLPVGHGVVKLQDRWKQPFVIQIPSVSCDKGRVTDEVVRAYLRPDGTLSGLRGPEVRTAWGEERSRIGEEAVSEEELTFLHDVLTHQDGGVDTRYKRLGISADKGNRLKNALIRVGLIEEQRVSIGRTRRTLLRITPRARDKLGVARAADRGSLAHEYWKRWYAAQLAERGFTVIVEAPRNSGRVDVLARRGHATVAVEIETGKSDVVTNVREDLLSGFRTIMVVATDERAKAQVEAQLAHEGLVMERIIVVLRGALDPGWLMR